MNGKNTQKDILLVEDDDADSEIVEILLKRSNIRNPIYRARDGVEALDTLREMTADEKLDRPFLLVVDIYLQRMSGLKFLENVRLDDTLKCHMSVILTTSNFMYHRTRAYSLNVAGYILNGGFYRSMLRDYSLSRKFERDVQRVCPFCAGTGLSQPQPITAATAFCQPSYRPLRLSAFMRGL